MTILAGLIENGVNPEALAAVVKELKRETEALKVSQSLITFFEVEHPSLYLGGHWSIMNNNGKTK